MKAIVPISYAKLPKREQEIIKDYMEEACQDRINEQYADLQVIWLKFACTILADAFHFNEEQLIAFMGNWRRVYRQAARRETDKANTAYLEKRMAEIFPSLGFPDDYVNDLRGK